MTVYSDALGNKFLGNCKWGNHDINYPSSSYLINSEPARNFDQFRDDVVSLLTSAGFTGVTYDTPWYSQIDGNPQGSWTNFLTGVSPSTGLAFYIRSYYGGGGTSYFRVQYNDALNFYVATSNIGSARTAVWNFFPNDSTTTSGLHGSNGQTLGTTFNTVSVASQYGFGFVSYRDQHSSGKYSYPFFLLMTELVDVNSNFGYYTSNANHAITIKWNVTSTVTISDDTIPYGTENSYNYFRHYIVGTAKDLLQTGDAIYPIACSNGATPTGQWATDMWVFDNNADLGYPCIGRVPNMLLGVGTFTYLKPVELITAPDAGSNLWLPVGSWGGSRTLLMRCYSE